VAQTVRIANMSNNSVIQSVNKMMKTPKILVTLLAGGALVSCTQTQQQYGLGGAAAGAAAGALLGDGSDGILKGAALGAAAGVGTAAYKENQQRNAGAYNTGGDYRAPIPIAPPAPVDTSNYKVATPTNRPGIVRSPYPPFSEVNVSALKTGDQARVPGSNQIFLVP
jgi:hypothetical protein